MFQRNSPCAFLVKSILLFKGLPLFGILIFLIKNTPTPLCLCRNKTKGQFGKNTTLTPTKTLPKKQGHFPVNFQIILSTYKLDFQNKNYIYKIKTEVFFFFWAKIKSLIVFFKDFGNELNWEYFVFCALILGETTSFWKLATVLLLSFKQCRLYD